jgi:hypothetical protein
MRIIRDMVIDKPGWAEHWCTSWLALSIEVIMAVEGDSGSGMEFMADVIRDNWCLTASSVSPF